MFKRILRSLTMLAALLVAYEAYVLLAVPLMEPPIAMRKQPAATQSQKDLASQSVTMYQLLLSNYFPKDHWSQKRPPKVFSFSDEKGMLVIDAYTREDGKGAQNQRYTQVNIERFALLVFPTPPREGITPPRDALILEAPQGAQLQFDVFSPERAKIGQILRGHFPGRITIRSDMHEPGPEDDLLVETADLEMNTKLLYTNSPVRFRMGANVGGGRELEIRFLDDEQNQRSDSGLKIAGIDALEIRRDVRMRLQLETDSLLPGDDNPGTPGSHVEDPPGRAPRGNEEPRQGDKKPNPPVEVTCSGPFTFDFVRYVASLDRDVDLRQINPNGPSDQLVCNQLDIHFAPKPLPGEATKPVVVDPGNRQQRDLGRLEPAGIDAKGHPVVLTSPAHNAHARGDRIQIALRDQRVRIGGARDAMLVYGPNVLRAPVIDYQHPSRESASTIGRFRATGPGTIRYVPDPAKPQQVMQAAWQTMVDMNRKNGQLVLALDGRPQLAFAESGSLTADSIKVYLRELEGKPVTAVGVPIAAGSEGGGKLQVVPDRLAATGRVDIQSAQLTGRTGELLVTFRVQPQAAGDAAPATGGGLAGQLTGPPGARQQQAFHIDTDKMQMEVHLQGESAAPDTLVCDGNVVLREMSPAGTHQQPLEIRGGRLTVDRLSTPAPYITLRGPGATGSASAVADNAGTASDTQLPVRPAQLSGRGVTVLAAVVELELDGRNIRMWSDGPGNAKLLVTRDLNGQESTTPFPLDISWQAGLQFDGSTIAVNRNVLVAGTDDTLRCDRLLARLTAPIEFGARIDEKSINLSEIDCQGQVAIDHVSRDPTGVVSHERAQLARLTINQQTGAISGEGPGVIRSTRFGDGFAALAVQPAAALPREVPPPPAAAGSKLHFLRVDFRRGLQGNLYTRELTFFEQVRNVYGPVDAWEQELDASRPQTLPPDAMTLNCDELRINEDPIATRSAPAVDAGSRPIGYVQLRANGNVRIDGQAPGQGAFSAQAGSASYEQVKDVFILEGDGRTPATLWREGQQGAPPAARMIRYSRSTGEVSVNGIEYIEITPGDVENARRTRQVR